MLSGETMRRSMVALLATGLLGAAASAVLAQSPAPFGLGGRVEVSGAGYALTLPDGWAYLRPATDDDGTLAAFIEAELEDQDLATRMVVLATEMRPDDITLLGMAEGRSNCFARSTPSGGLTLESLVVADLPEPIAEGDLTRPEATVTYLTLPAGAAARIDISEDTETAPSEHVETSEYVMTDGITHYRLTCSGPLRPADHWLSIAETFEILSWQHTR